MWDRDLAKATQSMTVRGFIEHSHDIGVPSAQSCEFRDHGHSAHRAQDRWAAYMIVARGDRARRGCALPQNDSVRGGGMRDAKKAAASAADEKCWR
jgi:hypothetical protein